MGQVCSSCDESFGGACSWSLGAFVAVAGWPDFESFETFEISSQHGPKHNEQLLTIFSTVLSPTVLLIIRNEASMPNFQSISWSL